MNRLLFVVVLYQTKPDASKTLRSLSKLDLSSISAEFAVWDNSSEGYGADSIPTLPGPVSYSRSGSNEGLASVYNAMIAAHPANDWVVILDDDSILDRDYIDALPEFFGSGVLLGVPRIHHQGRLISPGSISGVRGKASSATSVHGVHASKGVAAMMSGSIINRRVFEQGLRFDERLRLYGVDTKFFIDFATRHSQLFVLDCSMAHSSALRERGDVVAHIARCRNLMRSWSVVFETVRWRRARLAMYMLAFSFRLAFVRHDVRYITLLTAIPSLFVGARR